MCLAVSPGIELLIAVQGGAVMIEFTSCYASSGRSGHLAARGDL